MKTRAQIDLDHLFDTGLDHMHNQSWQMAERAFATIVAHAPDYERDGQRASHLLKNAQFEQKGEAALRAGDLPQALKAYQQADNFKRAAKIHIVLKIQEMEAKAKQYEQKQNWREAVWIYDQLINEFPDHKRWQAWKQSLSRCWDGELAPYFDAGIAALEKQEWSRARQAFTKVICSDPFYRRHEKSASVLLEMVKQAIIQAADEMIKEGHIEQALASYREVGHFDRIRQVEEFLQLRAQEEAKAHTYMKNEQWLEAKATYEYLQTLYYDADGRIKWQQAAKRCAREAYLSVRFDRGLEAMKAGEWSQAKEAFSKVVKLRPSYAKNGLSAKRLRRKAAVNVWLSTKLGIKLRPLLRLISSQR